MIPIVLAAVVAAASPLPVPDAVAPPASPKLLTFEALRAEVSVRQPQISPDGKRVVYVRGVNDYKKNEELTELVLVDVATKARRVLTQARGGVQSPSWSPDGARIAFIASPAKDEPGEVFVLDLGGGDAKQITQAKGVGGFAWRPDGGALAYVAGEPSPSPAPSAVPTPKGFVEAFAVTDEHFLTRSPSKPRHVFVIDADGTNKRQLTHGSASARGQRIGWTPDGTQLVIGQQPDAVFAHASKRHSVLVDAVSGAQRPLRADTIDGGAMLSRDGTRAAVMVPRHASLTLHKDLVVRRLGDGADLTSAAALDRNVRWWDWLDERTLLAGAADGIRSCLYRVPLGGAPSKVDLGEIDFADDATVAKDGTLAFTGSREDRPDEIYVLRPGGAPVQLSDENAWIAGFAVARHARVDWVSDGLAVNGVLTYPVGYVAGKTYPLVLNIHGGPIATSYRDFNDLDQVLAARGYLVLQPNYRGSDNSGDAFLQAIVGSVASGPGRDNLAGVEAVKKLGIVDATRIGVSGWSGGGLQTSWLIGHATFWRAAVSGAGVDDWFEQAVLSDINEEFVKVLFGGLTPWSAEGAARYRAESPLAYAAAVKTPTLIISDTGDQRVPITQSFAFYRALQAHGVPVRFAAIPRSGHFPDDPVGSETALRLWADWFDKWMK